MPSDEPCLNDWASRFRQHYCLDSELDDLCEGTGKTKAEYLVELVFPNKSTSPGPSIRSGDFAELLISDFVEHLLGYWVPREKYMEKASPNESAKGVDVLGFKMHNATLSSSTDELLVFEVKAQLSNSEYDNRLQTAIDDSSKDYLRSAYTLNATKRRLIQSKQTDKAQLVQRFQNITDHPFVFRSGAVAVLSNTAYDVTKIQTSSVASHNNTANLDVLIVHGNELMKLVHALYERAANEA